MAKNGLGIVPDRIGQQANAQRALPSFVTDFPTKALERALVQITNRYGFGTSSFVALRFEYPNNRE